MPDDVLRLMTGHSDAAMTDLYDHPSIEDHLARLLPARDAINAIWTERAAPRDIS